MPELINSEYFQLPLELLESNLDFLKGFYNKNLIEDIDNAKLLIDKYEKAIAILSEIANLDQLIQPQPEVPQFVANWYEKHKDSLEYCIWEYITEWDNQEKDDFFDFMNYSTFKPIQTLVNMHQFGYTVEKEKLYTVEIPNPNERQLSFVLMRQLSGNVSITVMHRDNLDLLNIDNNLQLTESEIRKDFDWAWQFRKDVENE